MGCMVGCLTPGSVLGVLSYFISLYLDVYLCHEVIVNCGYILHYNRKCCERIRSNDTLKTSTSLERLASQMKFYRDMLV